MKTINCAECKNEFNYEPPKGYPDKRKYCDPCGVKRKEQYNAAQASSEDAKPEAETATTTHGMKTKTSSGDNTDWEIGNRKVRLHALASAIEVLEIKLVSVKEVDALLNLAKTFEQYILTGE